MAPKSTTPSKFQIYLSRRWAEGCTTGRDLLPEIKYLGYTDVALYLMGLCFTRCGSSSICVVALAVSRTAEDDLS